MSNTLRQRRSKAKIKRATHKRDRVEGAAEAIVASAGPMLARANALMTKLDGNPEIRKQLIARLVKIAEKAPVVALHQVCQVLEMSQE